MNGVRPPFSKERHLKEDMGDSVPVRWAHAPRVIHGDLSKLSGRVQEFVEHGTRLCQPDSIHICDGTEKENGKILNLLESDGVIKSLTKYENCWLAKTDPKDVARVESRTVIVTENQRDTVPIPAAGVKGQLGNWMNPKTFQEAVDDRFPGCMKGRTMYVIPYSMGPISSPLSKIGIQLTDSAYVVASMRIMTRMGTAVLRTLGDGEFVKCLHSVGRPLPLEGCLRAINPENGFFGVAPGTSTRTNPNAMHTIQRNTIFTNVAETSEGGVYWEGIDQMIPAGVTISTWQGKPWQPGDKQPAAHPNSRFCAPARQCPIMDPDWESPKGVPIDAIIFGGRRPAGVPLVYEAFNWRHGVFVGSAMRSESTAAAEHKGKVIMHDPFAMRPFFGYNFGRYLEHWLSMEERKGVRLPKIFHVNWFRKDAAGNFLWPGFGENSRVLDWVFRRVDGEDSAKETPIGYIPKDGALDLTGLTKVNHQELFSLPKEFWEQEVREVRQYLTEQVNEDLPKEVMKELEALENRVKKM
ncbi:hypothetical protein lerEdw1_010170 [Lerista edwardsae]|nr:hypothetical protein lerEdw1_010170 [Lerista edwardsae]